jgi:4-amino-4-deoxy-L-arabinose transferase-like glycosyltransferase
MVRAVDGPDLLDRFAQGWRGYVLIALLALAAALPGVFTVPPLDRDESRFAQASLQMLESGDYVRIAVQDEPRNKKPVGIYWLQAASVSLFSSPKAHAIWAYRLPSVLGALIAALATLWGGTALLGRRAAFAGAALLACSLLLSTEAMIAKTDAMLCGLTALAMAALAHLYIRRDGAGTFKRAMALVFWCALACGVLVKGPVTPLVAGLCLMALAAWRHEAHWMRALLWPPALIAAALIVLPWGVAIALATHGQFFADAVGGDLGRKLGGGDEGHSGLPGYHAVLVWLLLFPATIALPGALRAAWAAVRGLRADPRTQASAFLIAWAGPIWLVFEMLPTKLPHYVLPAYPALALMCGAALIDAFETPHPRVRRAARVLAIVGILALIAVTAALVTLMPGDAEADARRAVTAAIVGVILLIPAAALILLARAPALLIVTACAAGLVFNWSARARILPEARPYLVSAEASHALTRAGLHPRLSPGAGPLTSVGYNEPSFVFLTRTDTRLLNPAPAAAAARPGESAIVEARQRAPFEAALAARGLAFAPIGAPVTGFDYSDGDDVSLQPGRIISRATSAAP